MMDDSHFYIDTHAHLDDERFANDLPLVLERAQTAGLRYIINVAYDLSSSYQVVEMAAAHGMIYAAVGIHPHDAAEVPADYIKQLQKLAGQPKVVAIGEAGLDYYRNLSPRDIQQKVFAAQLQLAKEMELPIIIHSRDAHADTLTILQKYGPFPAGGVMHCFSGSWETARQCLKMGFYISFAGPVTFPNARKLKEVARQVPLDRLLVETDCPYLAPQAHRGQRNEPSYVRYVVEEIAVLKNLPPVEVAKAVGRNACRLFRLPLAPAT